MTKNYLDSLLRVDLGSGQIRTESLSGNLKENFLGGSGLGAKLLFDEVPKGTNPLGSANKLMLLNGPLTGTTWPTVGRTVFVTKSPQTGIWGESHVGGFLGPELTFSGYDGLVVEGTAEKPVFLWIHNGTVELRSADHLWGMKTDLATKKILEETHQDAQVAIIGPAGEKKANLAAIIVNLARAAGRTGMGAVMGSKNLKAIAVKGDGAVGVHDLEKFLQLSKEANQRILNSEQAMEMRKFGTNLLVAYKSEIGELVTRNHTKGTFSQAELLLAENLREKYFKKTRSCFSCALGCKKAYKVTEGPFACESEGPEYEGTMAFGTNCENPDFGSILLANKLSNELGIDVISAGCTIAFAMELFEKGIISEKDTGGLDLSWGNSEAVVKLVEQIGEREGFGDLLAEGSYHAAQKLGSEAIDSSVHVKKMEISGQDGRTHRSMALGHATAARGGDHLRSLITVDQLSYEDIARERFGEKRMPEVCDPYTETHKAYATKITEDVYAIRDTLIVCWYTCSWPPIFWMEDFASILPAAIGGNWSEERLFEMGERIIALKRLFNVREGITRADDTLPRRFFSPMPDGPGKGQVVHLEPMLDEYYGLRGWKKESGIPLQETLKRLDLGNEAKSLVKDGIDIP